MKGEPALPPGPDAADASQLPALYLTVHEVAKLLRVSDKSVLRYAQADATMPVLRLGGVLRFRRERLERWLRDREQGAPRMRRRVRSVAKPLTTKASVDG